MTILALAFAAAAIAGCIVLGVVVDRQQHTIDRLARRTADQGDSDACWVSARLDQIQNTLDRIHPEVLRPDTCCGACPPVALSSLAHGRDEPLWDCTCADNPNCPNYQGETND